MDESTTILISQLESDFSLAILASQMIAATAAESASLWLIRMALLLMVVVFSIELRGGNRTDRMTASLWLAGAVLALGHGIGTVATFHHGSQTLAFESTAQRTEQLLGIRFGAGLFVNYVFLIVWLVDALMAILLPVRYRRLQRLYVYATDGFLLFIAINGAIVFQTGWSRSIGVISLIFLLMLVIQRRFWTNKSCK